MEMYQRTDDQKLIEALREPAINDLSLAIYPLMDQSTDLIPSSNIE